MQNCLFVCALGLPIGKYREVMRDWWLQIVAIVFQTSIEHLTAGKVNVLRFYLVIVSILHLFYFALRWSNAHMATLPPGVADVQNVPCKHSISEYHKTSRITYLNFYFPKQKKHCFYYNSVLIPFFQFWELKPFLKFLICFETELLKEWTMGKWKCYIQHQNITKIKLTCKQFFTHFIFPKQSFRFGFSVILFCYIFLFWFPNRMLCFFWVCFRTE